MTRLSNKLVVILLGPTAVGKTDLSIQLAKHFKTEIISCDSRQFYREMNIGTAKPETTQLKDVKHHLINSLSILDAYNVYEFEKDAVILIERILESKDMVFITGGSGLFIDAIINGIDPDIPGENSKLRAELNETLKNKGITALQERLKAADPGKYNEIDVQNPRRLIRAIEIANTERIKSTSEKKRMQDFRTSLIGLNIPRSELYERINKRVDEMIRNGLVEEAKELYKFKEKNALKTVGYQELFRYFEGEISKEEAIEKIKQHTRNYAKRQITWFRRYDEVRWFRPHQVDEIIELIQSEFQE